MDTNELAKLGYDTDGLTPGADYVPNVVSVDDGIHTELVHRGYLQLEELNGLGGVNTLGGPSQRLDDIHLAMEGGVDLVTSVGRYGDEGQQQEVRHLIAVGKVSGS